MTTDPLLGWGALWAMALLPATLAAVLAAAGAIRAKLKGRS